MLQVKALKNCYKLKLLSLLSISILLSSCSDIIDGTVHMAYGFTTFMLGLFKLVVFILIAILVIGLIVNIIKKIFGG